MATHVFDAFLQEAPLRVFRSDFIGKANRILQEPDLAIPDVVQYGEPCRGLCCSTTPAFAQAMAGLLWHELGTRFSPDVVNQDILLLYEVFRHGQSNPVFGFSVLAACACRYGRHPARQDFLMLDISHKPEVGSYEGCILKARRKDKHLLHESIPRNFARFFAGARGMLDIMTEDCAHCLCGALPHIEKPGTL